MKKSLSIILVCFMLLTTFVTSAYALEAAEGFDEEVAYELTVGCVLKGSDENDESFIVTITPDDYSPDFETSTLNVKANQSGSFGSVKIIEPNVYSYTVVQSKGENNKITYDETEYKLVLDVTTDDEGLLTVTHSIENLSTGEKVDGIEFVNVLETEVPKTGDTSTLIAWGIPLALLVIALGVVGVSYIKLSKAEKEKEDKGKNEE